jgi:hypothetical protein
MLLTMAQSHLESSFEMFIESLCKDDLTYRLRVWRQIVTGHGRHVALLDQRNTPRDQETDKIRHELASAIEYGRIHNFSLVDA